MEEVLEEEKLSDNATEQKKRDFMKQMRNLDAKMFNYPRVVITIHTLNHVQQLMIVNNNFINSTIQKNRKKKSGMDR